MATTPVTSPSYFGNYGNKDQPTLNGVTDYIAEARTLLQDAIAPYRYDDPSLIRALNISLLEAKMRRADLFVYNLNVFGQVQSFQANDNTYVDVEPPFRQAILHLMVGHAAERDQEDFVNAPAFLMMGIQGLVGRALTPLPGGRPGGP